MSSYPEMSCYSEGTYRNTYNGALSVLASPIWFLNGIEQSVFRTRSGDRQWMFRYCWMKGENVSNIAQYEQTTTEYREDWDTPCDSHSAMCGVQSSYLSSYNDRAWIWWCGALDTTKYNLTDCYDTDYINDYRSTITNAYCDNDGVIQKVHSVFNSNQKDRKWKFTCCSIANLPTSLPTLNPVHDSTVNPTLKPTLNPTLKPTTAPVFNASQYPTLYPIVEPSVAPSLYPSAYTTRGRTNEPSVEPSLKPSYPVIIEVSSDASNGVTVISTGSAKEAGTNTSDSILSSERVRKWIMWGCVIFGCCVVVVMLLYFLWRRKKIQHQLESEYGGTYGAYLAMTQNDDT